MAGAGKPRATAGGGKAAKTGKAGKAGKADKADTPREASGSAGSAGSAKPGKPPQAPGAPATDTAPPAAAPKARLARAAEDWAEARWNSLAQTDARGARGPDRGRLLAHAALGQAQTGDLDRARDSARAALAANCPPHELARLLSAGALNALACADVLSSPAALADTDTAGLALFEAAARTFDPDAPMALTRKRARRETTRLGLLDETHTQLTREFDRIETAGLIGADQADIFRSELEILGHEITLSLQRAQGAPPQGQAATTDRSTAQLGQDLWVLECTGHKRGGFFVEFGATDGVRLNNTYLLETGYGWRGILAEPNPAMFAQLERNRGCTLARDVILGESGREVTFILADVYGGVAEFGEDDMHADKRRAYRDEGHWLTATSISLDAFLEKHGAPRDIDYISVDTEGSEFDILSRFPFDKWNVSLWTVEHNFMPQRDDIRALMLANGYRVVEQSFDDWYWRPPAQDPSQDPATSPARPPD